MAILDGERLRTVLPYDAPAARIDRKLPEIGGAMAMDARICLFDEPFAGLFPQMLERVKTIIRQMRDDGRTIIFISHNMDIARGCPTA